ncbi:MarR family winged helix-turn-helix transcriptional regulator [Cohnella hongkongensis]|uniref:MarR family winged helix-turn-helix transcriptional regulator n=1 Tax=Cohnella hongkongensis TaxID=178337 RepID=A0ABV9FI98_9BACL
MEDAVRLIQEINQIEYEINARLRFEFDQLIDDTLTDKQLIVLELIRSNPSIHAGEIAQRLRITPSAVSQILNALEKKKRLTRTINPDNRREIRLELTPEAENDFEKMETVERAIIQKYYSQLAPEELLQLKSILTKLNEIVQRSDEEEKEGEGT